MPATLTNRFDEELARHWWPYCERWARRLEGSFGGDFASAANRALWYAASVDCFAPFEVVLRTALRNALTSVREYRRVRDGLAATRPMIDDPVIDDPAISTDSEDAYLAMLARLDEDDRNVVDLVCRFGHSKRSAAKELGISYDAANWRYRRAITQLRAAIEETDRG